MFLMTQAKFRNSAGHELAELGIDLDAHHSMCIDMKQVAFVQHVSQEGRGCAVTLTSGEEIKIYTNFSEIEDIMRHWPRFQAYFRSFVEPLVADKIVTKEKVPVHVDMVDSDDYHNGEERKTELRDSWVFVATVLINPNAVKFYLPAEARVMGGTGTHMLFSDAGIMLPLIHDIETVNTIMQNVRGVYPSVSSPYNVEQELSKFNK
jgi:hypothetical protein